MSDITQVYHDSAGWHHLETSVKCLQLMIQGCGDQFGAYIDDGLMQLVFSFLVHKNRFVRETGFLICAALVSCQTSVEIDPDNSCKYKSNLYDHLALGLSDNWSEVRMAASIATRHFLCNIRPVESRVEYFPRLLPPMCLNRYW